MDISKVQSKRKLTWAVSRYSNSRVPFTSQGTVIVCPGCTTSSSISSLGGELGGEVLRPGDIPRYSDRAIGKHQLKPGQWAVGTQQPSSLNLQVPTWSY
jgi:hypothetical protein